MIQGIDHILIAVDDVELASEVYQKLGFQVLPGGKHPNAGTYNALVPLTDGIYFELIGVWDQTLAEENSPYVVETLKRDNRLARFALLSDNLDADVAAIRARGFEIADPHDGERDRPDGQKVAWRSAIPADARYPFLIQDVTPRELRIPAPTEGIGRTIHLNDVNVGVTDLMNANETYQQLLGVDGEEGWFHLPLGDIVLKDVDTERLLQIVLGADSPLDVIKAWQDNGVEYDQQIIGGMGLTLEPFQTEGAPMIVTARIS